jgi:hypothetical protein
LVIKTLDPDWILIRIDIQPKMMVPDPKPWYYLYNFTLYYLWLLVFFGSELQLLLASVWSSRPPTTSTLTASATKVKTGTKQIVDCLPAKLYACH